MKKLIALLLLSPLAFAEYIEFNLDCKITAQSIMTTENGIAAKYNSVEGKRRIGETFPVNFKYTDSPSWDDHRYEITIESTGSIIDLLLYANKEWEKSSFDCEILNPSVCASGLIKSDPVLKRKYGMADEKWDISENSINGDMYDKPATFKRYYKNDWELMISNQVGTTSYALSANCMWMPNKYDRLLRALKEQYDKK